MAVIIPNMDIPDNCYHCQLEKDFFCTAGKFYVRDAITGRTKHEKCPLKEVSDKPNGKVGIEMRLIDADALIETMRKKCGGICSDCNYADNKYDCELVKNAPTVDVRKIVRLATDNIKTDIGLFVKECRGGNDIDIHDVFKIIDNHS